MKLFRIFVALALAGLLYGMASAQIVQGGTSTIVQGAACTGGGPCVSTVQTTPQTMAGPLNSPSFGYPNGTSQTSAADASFAKLAVVAQHNPSITPVNLIVDENFGNDWDAAAGFAELNTLVQNGEANVLALVSDNGDVFAGPDHQAFAQYFGIASVPVGICTGTCINTNGDWGAYVAANWPNTLAVSGSTAESALTLLRTTLAAQPDGSVTYVAEGLMRNLFNLYNSPADGISPLTGAQLIAAKVGTIVACCGDYPTGSEFNLTTDPVAAQVINNLTTAHIIWIGSNLGLSVPVTVTQAAGTAPNSPALYAYTSNGATTRAGWTSLDYLYATRGLSHGSETYFTTTAAGYNTVDSSGNNTFFTNAAYSQHYLVAGESTTALSASINALVNVTPFSQVVANWNLFASGSPINYTGSINGELNNVITNTNTGTSSALSYSFIAGSTNGQVVSLGQNYSGAYGTLASSVQLINRNGDVVIKAGGYHDVNTVAHFAPAVVTIGVPLVVYSPVTTPLVTGSLAVTIIPESGAGSGATASCYTASGSQCTLSSGFVQVTTGTTPTIGSQFRVTISGGAILAHSLNCVVVAGGGGPPEPAAALLPGVAYETATWFEAQANVAPAASTPYYYSYMCGN